MMRNHAFWNSTYSASDAPSIRSRQSAGRLRASHPRTESLNGSSDLSSSITPAHSTSGPFRCPLLEERARALLVVPRLRISLRGLDRHLLERGIVEVRRHAGDLQALVDGHGRAGADLRRQRE